MLRGARTDSVSVRVFLFRHGWPTFRRKVKEAVKMSRDTAYPHGLCSESSIWRKDHNSHEVF